MEPPISWTGAARTELRAAVGVDPDEAWVEAQLPALRSAARQRLSWPVRGELIVDGVFQVVFLFVSTGVGRPWRGSVLDRRGSAGAEAGDGPVRLDAASIRFSPAGALDADGLVVDWSAGSASVNGREVVLTRTEFRLLCELAQHAGIALTHRHLVERVWQEPLPSEDAVVMQVSNLRSKLAEYGRLIVAVPTVGYRFDAPGSAGGEHVFDDLWIDPLGYRVWTGDRELELAPSSSGCCFTWPRSRAWRSLTRNCWIAYGGMSHWAGQLSQWRSAGCTASLAIVAG